MTQHHHGSPDAATERFVSLYGFFAFAYPRHWTQEVDASGQYVFSNDSGGSGVLRVIVLDNEFEGEDAAKKMLEEVYNQNKLFSPSLYAAGTNRFVSFVKEHDVNGAGYTVYYWATAHQDKVVLLTYTVQTGMKNMDAAETEKRQIESIMASFEFLHDTASQG
jgi:hypothetical protein